MFLFIPFVFSYLVVEGIVNLGVNILKEPLLLISITEG